MCCLAQNMMSCDLAACTSGKLTPTKICHRISAVDRDFCRSFLNVYKVLCVAAGYTCKCMRSRLFVGEISGIWGITVYFPVNNKYMYVFTLYTATLPIHICTYM